MNRLTDPLICPVPSVLKRFVTLTQGKRYFSPFCWATRMAIAHKGIPVETIPWWEQQHLHRSSCQSDIVLSDAD